MAGARGFAVLRQLDIGGVDTRFIESHRGLLAELLDAVLPAAAVAAAATGAKGVAQRYGLRTEPPSVRFGLPGAGNRSR